MSQAAITLLAQRLPAGIIHPGTPNRPAQVFPLPGLATTGMPAEMSAYFADEAGLPHDNAPLLLAEAIVHTITADGDSTIIPNTELAELRAAAAAAPDHTRIITVHTACDRARTRPILELTVTKTTDLAVIPCTAVKALLRRHPDCPHKAI